MRALVLSDIHANLEALEAVLAHASGAYDQLWNLGDMVGYGASPNQVLDRIRPLASLTVRGNHDRVAASLTSAAQFNPIARAAAFWTRRELTEANLQYLRELPRGPIHCPAAEATCAHGSPLHEDHYIVTMRDAWSPLQQMSTPITFFGHTHIQGGFSQHAQEWHELRPQPSSRVVTEPTTHTLPLEPGARHLINPGSVGQPRDHDPRAAYALFDIEAQTITFHRVPYDIQLAQQKIRTAALPERLAARLAEGR